MNSSHFHYLPPQRAYRCNKCFFIRQTWHLFLHLSVDTLPFAGRSIWSPLEDSQISRFPRMTVVHISACPTSCMKFQCKPEPSSGELTAIKHFCKCRKYSCTTANQSICWAFFNMPVPVATSCLYVGAISDHAVYRYCIMFVPNGSCNFSSFLPPKSSTGECSSSQGASQARHFPGRLEMVWGSSERH